MTNEEIAARNAELVAALKAEHARIKRKRDASDQMLDALRNLSNEVRGFIGAFETELRSADGHTNYNVLMQREEEARAAIRVAEGG